MSKDKENQRECDETAACQFETITSQTLARFNESQSQMAVVANQNFIASQNLAQQAMLKAMFPPTP